MKIKYYVGKDRTIKLEKDKQKRPAPMVCKACGDDLKPAGQYRGEGVCMRCKLLERHYRDVDNARFRAFQAQMAGRSGQ